MEGMCVHGEIGRSPSLAINVQVLLGLLREVVVLGGRIILPRVEVRHGGKMEDDLWRRVNAPSWG